MTTKVAPTKKALRGCRSGCISGGPSQDVERREQRDPDDVDEVPVDGRRLNRVVMPGRELAGHRSVEDHAEHDRAAQDMGAVEARQREERGPERSVGQSETELRVVVRLAAEEEDAEDERPRDAAHEAAPSVLADRPARPLAGE